MKKLIFLFAIALLTLTNPALAGSLSSGQVEKFIGSWSDVKVLADKMEAEGKNEVLNAKMKPVPGQDFKPYSRAVGALKSEFSGEYSELGDIVGKHGFSSQESWAATGDDVMHAYAASQMQASGHSADAVRAQMPPEVMAQMPPQAKAQMEASLAMLEQFKDVPAENIAAVKPYAGQIETMMNE